MALPNSGALSLSSIQGEFGGSNPCLLYTSDAADE